MSEMPPPPPPPSPAAPPVQPQADQLPPNIPPVGALSYARPSVGQYVPTQEEKTMAMLCWLLALLTGWLGPLIIWLVKREQSRFVDFHGKQALFARLAMFVICFPLIFLMLIPFVGCILIPFVLLLALGCMVLDIIMAVKANAGEWYRLPIIGQWL